MKKEYAAPDLYFESFELSESIATGCSTTGKMLAEGFTSSGYFASNITTITCTNEYSDSLLEDYCYWQGTSETALLLS